MSAIARFATAACLNCLPATYFVSKARFDFRTPKLRPFSREADRPEVEALREHQPLPYARRFAMHAIEQHRRDTVIYDQQRYPLWAGDPG